MLSLLITVFIFSVVAMIVMVIRKAMAIRGLPQAPAKPFILDATPHPHRIRSFIKEISKEGVHIILLTFTKAWLLIGKEWKRMLKRHFPKMYKGLYEYHSINDRSTTSSFFLATITEYKEKTKRLRERIKHDHEIPDMPVASTPRVRKPRATKKVPEVSEGVESNS